MSDIDQRLAALSPEKRALLGRRLEERQAPPRSPQRIVRRSDTDAIPLSFGQERLWFLDQLDPGQFVYNRPANFLLRGLLDETVLRRCLDEVVSRHEALRTGIHNVAGRPAAVLEPPRPLPVKVIDLSDLSPADRQREADRVARAEAQQPFDLTRPPFVRAQLIRLAASEHLLLLTFHHIVFDGWSQSVLVNELASLYGAFSRSHPSPLPALPVQYADYVAWQRAWLQDETAQTLERYWRAQLANAPATLNVPTDHPRPARQSFNGAVVTCVLPEGASRSLKDLSQREGATLFMTLLAAFKTLLFRYTGQDDIVVGTPVAGRSWTEIEALLGFFMNMLVMRTDLSGSPTFRALLGRVRDMAVAAYDHQALPFERLIVSLQPERDLSHNPFFQTTFQLRNLPRAETTAAGLEFHSSSIDTRAAAVDLAVEVVDDQAGLSVSITYATDLFDRATIERMAGHYRTLLEGIIADADTPIATLPLLTAAERHRMLLTWNDTAADFPRDSCVHHLFEAQVARTPDAVAVEFESRRLTYRELDARANGLAGRLRSLGVGPDVSVAICLDRSPEMIVALLGTLKAGGAYVPLDPTYPLQRLAFMLEDSQAAVLLTTRALCERLPLKAPAIVCVEADATEHSRPLQNDLESGVRPDHLAYVIYTSGSTGTPKGVMIEHRALVNCLWWMLKELPLDHSDAVLQSTALGFDVSAWECFAPLLAGARLVLLAPGRSGDLACIRDTIERSKVSVAQVVPSMLGVLLDDEGGHGWGALKRVICGGEALPLEFARRWFDHLNVELVNGYGPSETCIYSTFWVCRRGDERVPIGRPIHNTQAYVLDHHLQPVPMGVAGELHLGGAGLARGYLRRPELTAEKFIPHPFSDAPHARLYKTGDLVRWLPDGTLEFLGRTDHQVKIRGVRIELGEVESVVAAHPAVQLAVTVVRQTATGDKRLVGYWVAKAGCSATPRALREHALARLPDYMVPASFVRLDAFPRLPNGKLDRASLPAPDIDSFGLRRPFAAPATPVQRTLARIWTELLEIDRVSIHQSFFELGGDSLMAVRLFARIEQRFGQKLALSVLFGGATIEDLASILESTPTPRSRDWIAVLKPDGTQRPLFVLPSATGDLLLWRDLMGHLDPDRPWYGLQPRRHDGRIEMFPTIPDMAAAYLQAVRDLQPHGPYSLAGASFGGAVAFEMAQQLTGQGETVSLLAMLDAGARQQRPRSVTSALAGVQSILANVPWWVRYDLWESSAPEILARARRHVRRLMRTVKSDHGTGGPPPGPWAEDVWDLAGLPATYRELLEQNYRAWFRYTPTRYSGSLVLFRARAQPLLQFRTPDLGWRRIAAGGVTVEIVPGHHDNIFREPHVRVLADRLRRHLDRTM